MHLKLPKPTNEADFERLVKDWSKLKFNLNSVCLYGRKGQSQCGIDIYGITQDKNLIVIQCKNYINDQSFDLLKTKIENDLEKFEKFEHKNLVKTFYVVTALDNDTKSSDFAIKKNFDLLKINSHGFEIIFWDEVSQDLQKEQYEHLYKDYYRMHWKIKMDDQEKVKNAEKPTKGTGLTDADKPQSLASYEVDQPEPEPEYEGKINPITRISTPTNPETTIEEIKLDLNSTLQIINSNQTTKDLVFDIKDNPYLQYILFGIFLKNPEYHKRVNKIIEHVINPLIKHFSATKKLETDPSNKKLWQEVQKMYIDILNKQS